MAVVVGLAIVVGPSSGRVSSTSSQERPVEIVVAEVG